MTISTERLQAMLAAAEKATPGPWYQTGAPWFRDGTGVLAGSPDGNVAFLIADTDDFTTPRDEYDGFPLGDKEDDAAHIANCDPATIRELITELLASRSGVEGREAVIEECAREIESLMKGLQGQYEALDINREVGAYTIAAAALRTLKDNTHGA